MDFWNCGLKTIINNLKLNIMNKGYIIGGLVVLGAIVFIWNSTPKKNKEGFYNASGCGCGA